RHELAPAAAPRGAHLFPRLQRRPRGALRQVLGAGGAKLILDVRISAARNPDFRRPITLAGNDRAGADQARRVRTFDLRSARTPPSERKCRSAASHLAKPSCSKCLTHLSRSSAAQSNVAHHSTNEAPSATIGVTRIVAT